jgi:DNA polymerase-1
MPDDMPIQINRIEQILGAMCIPVLRVNGFEADDVIGTLVRKAGKEGFDCLICSNDKDVLQLLDENISTFDMKTDTRTDVKTMSEQLGVTPVQFVDCLALQGDASDNVPGVPDVGPKTAVNWIQKYGSIENLYAHVDEITGKRGENLRKFKDRLALSKKLVTIDCNVPMKVDYSELALKEFDKGTLTKIFTELGFSRLLSQAGLVDSGGSRITVAAAPQDDLSRAVSTETIKHDYRLIDTQEKFKEFFAELRKQKLFAIDTETTSISAMRAELVGLTFSWRPRSGYYIPVKGPLV